MTKKIMEMEVRKELNDSFEKEKQLWGEYYELERQIREGEE